MPFGFRSTGNVLDNVKIAGGLSISEIAGDGGAGPNGFTVILSVTGLVPGTGQIEITSPTTFPISAAGADGSGNLSVQTTWINSGDDINFLQVGGGVGAIPDGFWAQPFLIRGTFSLLSNNIGVDIQFSDDDVLSYTQDLTNAPSNPQHSNDTWDGSQGKTKLTWDYNISDTPASFVIKRNGVAIASVPSVGVGSYSYTDTVFAPGTYTYSVAAYKYPSSISPFSSSFDVTFGGPPTFEFVASGGMSFGGGALFGFLVDPSGVYTLTPGKTHDTIYNNTKAGNTTIDVKIPDPFVDTAFIGE